MNLHEESEQVRDQAKKALKYILPAFIFNGILLTAFIFAYNYAYGIGHWSCGAWGSMCLTSAAAKIVLSVLLVVNFNSYIKNRRNNEYGNRFKDFRYGELV